MSKEVQPSSKSSPEQNQSSLWTPWTFIALSVWKKLSKRSQPAVMIGVVMIYLCVMSLQLVDDSKQRRSAARGQAKIIPKSPDESILLAEFNRRKKIIKDTCEKFGAYTTREKLLAKLKLKPGPELSPGVEKDDQLWSALKRTSHHQFFVQKEHGLMWCKVPKAASTSWLHAYLTMAHVPHYEIPEDNGMGLHAFLREKYPLLSKNLNKQFMPVSLKFLVVRHPFERVISAYMDKLEDYTRDLKYRGGYYYAMYGADIVAKFRQKYQDKFPKNPLFMKKEPSFVEFVEFLIETPVSKYDEHWKPQFLLCPPCHFKFDVIVKMETFERDTNFILSQRNLDGVVSLTKKHSSVGEKKKKETNLVKNLFSQLSKNMVQALYEKYRIDFQMFEYDISDYVKYASESEGLMPDVIEVSVVQSESVEEEASDEVTSVESITKEP
eukprot:TRINITY_DN7013_c0_g1_i6.p1 TRINITY_DN7013_c0_g1~~TRINITY_DN7013_c0_g1_i6.p1  ORF type:complete len:438 (-),score=101.44 TRINITY_DN7013_c0_g1_i6:166-1479(-)